MAASKEGTSHLVLGWLAAAVQLVVLSLGVLLVAFPTFSVLWQEETSKYS